MSQFNRAAFSIRNDLDFIEPFSKQMYYSVDNSDIKKIILRILEDTTFADYFDIDITIKNLQNRTYSSSNVTDAKKTQGRLINIRHCKRFTIGIFTCQHRDYLSVEDGLFIDFPNGITDHVRIKCSGNNINIEIYPQLLTVQVYKSLFFTNGIKEFDTPEEESEYINKLFETATTCISIQMNYAKIIETMRQLHSDGILKTKSVSGAYTFAASIESSGKYVRIVQIHNIMQRICRH